MGRLGSMTLERQMIFWVVALAVFCGVLWLMSPVLLPFVAGMALAYLLDPFAHRRANASASAGRSRRWSCSSGRRVGRGGCDGVVPILADQFAAFMDSLPGYVNKVRSLLVRSEPAMACQDLRRNLPDAEKSVGDLVSQGSGCVATFLRRSGRAAARCSRCCRCSSSRRWSRSICSATGTAMVIDGRQLDPAASTATPSAACCARWTPRSRASCAARRCLPDPCGSSMLSALTLIGLNFGLLIGLIAGLITFIPYVGSMTGLLLVAGASRSRSSGRNGRRSSMVLASS